MKIGYRVKGAGLRNVVVKRIFANKTAGKLFFILIVAASPFTRCSLPVLYATQTPNAGFAGEYLMTFSASGRALGMGKAYNALADDAAAPYWNPAGLSSVISNEVTFLYSRLFGESVFSYLGYVHPFSREQTFAIGRAGLDSGSGEKVSALNSFIGSFQDKQSAYYFSYSRRMFVSDSVGRLDAGASLKIVTQDFDGEYNLGYGMDIGAIFHPGIKTRGKGLFNGLRLGMVFQNIMPPALGKNNFPINLRTGFSAEGIMKRLIFSYDVNFINFMGNAGKAAPVRWHTGAEYKITKTFVVRAGIDYKETSVGAGFVAKNFRVDYGVAVHFLDVTHRVGITGRFGMPLTEQELRVQEERKTLERSREAYNKMMQALKFYRLKDFASSKSALNNVLEIEPENEQALTLLSEVQVNLGKEETSKALINARENYDKMKYEDSLIAAKKVLDFDPENKEASIIFHLSQAQVSIDDERYEKAREELITVLKIDVTNQDAKIMLKRVEEALKFLK